MKKLLFIALLLGAFSMVGNAQSTPLKTYYFEYPSLPTNTYWYKVVDVYVNGNYYSTFQIGNFRDKPVSLGFTVPVGSEWYLWEKESYATRNGMACVCPVFISVMSGKATDSTMEMIQLYSNW